MSEAAFQIKLKGLDNVQIDMQTSSTTLVSELKQQIFMQTQIPVDRQRLLYNSKHLLNQQTLNSYQIQAGSVILFVGNLERSVEDDAVSDLIRTALEIFPNSYLNNRRGRVQPRRALDLSEKMETLRQNLTTIELIMKDSSAFPKYLWVDAKDTVDQWLEAQVVEVSASQVYIHYNGWPCRWDEWIDVNSPRIEYFRTHTQQSISAPMHSPRPVTPADTEYCKGLVPFDANDCYLNTIALADKIQVMMNNGSLSHNSNAVYDRFGRVFSDLALIIGNSNRSFDENESPTSSLVTNESGRSSASGLRPAMQVPVMPPPSELALMTPRVAQDFEFHIHAFVAMRDHEVDGPNV